MTILEDLKQIIARYDDADGSYPYKTVGKYAPEEWWHLPIDADEGRRVILERLKNHQDLPWTFISQSRTGSIHFNCGPVEKCPTNPNGYMHHVSFIHFIDVLYATHGVKVKGDRKY